MVSEMSLNAPLLSVTRTTNVFMPASLAAGVPESVPSAATMSHAGPLILANVSLSP